MKNSNLEWLTDELRNEYYTETGKLLGYRNCCIEFYLKCPNPMEAPEPQRIIWEQNGQFLLCENDARRIHAKECKVEDLIDHEERLRNFLPPFNLKIKVEKLTPRLNQILKEKDPVKWKELKL